MKEQLLDLCFKNNISIKLLFHQTTGGTGNHIKWQRYSILFPVLFWGGFQAENLTFAGDSEEDVCSMAYQFLILNSPKACTK